MNYKTLLPAAMFILAASATLSAQNPIKGASTDENYANTTVVYKDSTASDLDVLSRMDNSIGMGDVVRITVAPPKPAAAPSVAVKPTAAPTVGVKTPAAPTMVAKQTAETTVAANKPVVKPTIKVAVQPVQRSAMPQPAPNTANPNTDDMVASSDNSIRYVPSPTLSTTQINNLPQAPVVNESAFADVKEANTGTLSARKNVDVAAAPKNIVKTSSAKSTKSTKSYKKSSKKSNGWTLFAPKMKKHGKQRYNCYKF